MGTENGGINVAGWYSSLSYNQWVALPVTGPRPLGRYKHSAVVIGEKLYISGGSRNGRYLSDIQVLDIANSSWSSLKLTTETNVDKAHNASSLEAIPAISGHNMIFWDKKLLILGGLSKKYSNSVTVRYVDLETLKFGVLETTGKLPVAREGQSVTLVGPKLVMFGGEDISRRLLNDIHILDLETMTWKEVEATQTPPSPRYDHAAAVHAERYLLIFGGSSHSTCFNDLHVLDLQTMEWSQPEMRGDYVTPRAGHSGITINENWFIVGGGDNQSGAPETLVLDMTKLVWSVVNRVNQRDPLASEGISICSAMVDGDKYLVTFGGYNGRYNNEVFIMRPKLKDTTHPKIYQSPAAAAAAASVSAAYLIGSGKNSDPNVEAVKTELPQKNYTVDTDAIREEKRVLELSLAEVREENSKLREKIDDINNTHADLSKELLSVQGQLVSERSRCFKLEAQIAELRSTLGSLPAIEAEVESLRKQKSEWDSELATTVQRQGSRGMWQWISGGDS